MSSSAGFSERTVSAAVNDLCDITVLYPGVFSNVLRVEEDSGRAERKVKSTENWDLAIETVESQ